MNLEDIRTKIKKMKHEQTHRKRPFIYSRHDSKNTFLDWNYGKSKISVESDDWILISIIDDVIKRYLEETEKKE